MYLVELEEQVLNLEKICYIMKEVDDDGKKKWLLHFTHCQRFVELNENDSKIIQVHIEKMRKTMF